MIPRPNSFKTFLGQVDNLERLQIVTQAARRRGDPLGHILFSGPPGLGKTTLATILSAEMGTTCHTLTGPVLEKPADLIRPLTQLEKGDILFIDEIHRTPRALEEFLYSAMEDYCIDILVDADNSQGKNVRVPLQPFTLVGATTRMGLLTQPLISRFTLKLRLAPYTEEELQAIAINNTKAMGMRLHKAAALKLAKSCRGTPRILNNLLYFARDVAETEASSSISVKVVNRALALLGYTPCGLDEMDQKYLIMLDKYFNGGPAGLDNLGMVLGEDGDTLSEVHEPYLLQKGLIQRSPRGRLLTDKGKKVIATKFISL